MRLMMIKVMSDYDWTLAALNERLMNREKYERIGEDVDRVVARLQRQLMDLEYEQKEGGKNDRIGDPLLA